jgi:hypothetical protein
MGQSQALLSNQGHGHGHGHGLSHGHSRGGSSSGGGGGVVASLLPTISGLLGRGGVYSPVSHAEQALGDEPAAGLGQRLLSSFQGSGSYEGRDGEGEGKRDEGPGPALADPVRSHAAASLHAPATYPQQQQQLQAAPASRGSTGASDSGAGARGSDALRSLAADALGSIRFVFDSRELCTSLFLPLHASAYAARVTRSGACMGSSSAGSAASRGGTDDARACLRMTAVTAAAEGAAGASAATPRGNSGSGMGAAVPTRTHRISSWVDPQEALGPPPSPRGHLAAAGPAAGGRARPRDGSEAATASGGCLQKQHAVIELRRLHVPGVPTSEGSPCVYLLVAREQVTLLQAYFTAVTWLLCPA